MSDQMIIDAQRFAREGRVMERDLPFQLLPRLHDLLCKDHANWGEGVHFCLSGQTGAEGGAQLVLRIRGQLPLLCQRCLEPVVFALAADNIFELVASEDDIKEDEYEDDSRDYLVAEPQFDVAALVEEEVILSLPLVPLHDHCSLPKAEPVAEEASPFAALAGLKVKSAH